MIWRAILSLLLLTGIARADLATTLGLSAGDRIIIAGDSITEAQMYSNYLDAWLQLTYPELDLEVYVMGASGTSLAGWYGDAPPISAPTVSLWERNVLPFSPDLVFLMHGQNGGQNGTAHGVTYTSLWDDWISGTGTKLAMIGMHPVQSATDTKYAELKADAEATLATTDALMFSSHTFDQMGTAWLANLANTVDVVNLGAEPFTTSGTIVGDAAAIVHPGPAGHAVIAWAVLQGFGAESVVSQATLNASANTTTSSTNCTISSLSLTTTGGTFDRLDTRLPWALDAAGRANADAFAAAYSLGGGSITDWQDYSITITGLAAGSYEIKCDGVVIGTATHTELAAGWNMAGLTTGPVAEQCQSVLDAVRDLQGYDAVTGDKDAGGANTGTVGDVFDYAQVYYTSGAQRGATYLASMASAGGAGGPVGRLSTKQAAVHAAAQPVTRTYTITSTAESSYTPPLTWTPPIGIPDPGFGILTTAPAQPAGWPTTAEAGSYYIDNTHPSATDTANSYGTPDLPRLTIPSPLTLKAGSTVEIHGGPYEATTSTYYWRINSDATTPPTAGNPAFVRGFGAPVWTMDSASILAETAARIELGASPGQPLVYTVIEGLDLRYLTMGVTGNGSHHIAIRGCQSSLQFGNNKSCMSVGPSASGILHDIVFYDNELSYTQDWDNTAEDFDQHGIALSTLTRTAPTECYNVWVLDSEIHHVSGDSVQITGGTYGNDIMHHIYIGRNEAYQNRQSGFWCKEASDVIMSQNYVHDMDISGSGLSAYGFGSQYGANNLWFLFNEVENCGTGFGMSDSTGALSTSNTYYVGNYIHDLNQSNATYANYGRPMGWGFQFIQGVLGRRVIDNTVVNTYGGLFAVNAGPLTVEGNVFYGILQNEVGTYGTINDHLDVAFTTGVTLGKNILYGTEDGATGEVRVFYNSTQYATLASAQGAGILTGSLDSDPLLGAGVPGTGSPAIGAGTESSVYATFESLYGLDIRRDKAGIARPSGTWDLGAFEVSDTSGAVTITTGTLNTGTLNIGAP